MNKAALDQWWDQFRPKYGVYLRLLEAIPEDRYHTAVVPGLRTAAEQLVHTSGSIVRDIAKGVAKGSITADEASEGSVVAGLKTKAELIEYARRCWTEASAAVATIGDAQLAAMVPTPWKMTFPGWVGFNVMSDEFLHHRGQLAVYARLCGAVPPFIWGFGDNAKEFQPKG